MLSCTYLSSSFHCCSCALAASTSVVVGILLRVSEICSLSNAAARVASSPSNFSTSWMVDAAALACRNRWLLLATSSTASSHSACCRSRSAPSTMELSCAWKNSLPFARALATMPKKPFWLLLLIRPSMSLNNLCHMGLRWAWAGGTVTASVSLSSSCRRSTFMRRSRMSGSVVLPIVMDRWPCSSSSNAACWLYMIRFTLSLERGTGSTLHSINRMRGWSSTWFMLGSAAFTLLMSKFVSAISSSTLAM